jgi:CTP synthase
VLVVVACVSDRLHCCCSEKLAMFTQVPPRCVLAVHDVSNIFHVPLIMERQGAHKIISDTLSLPVVSDPRLGPWRVMAESVDAAHETVTIALVGKYTGMSDSYLSVLKALRHAAMACHRRLVVSWVDAETLEDPGPTSSSEPYEESWTAIRTADGILVPGGFGDRGVEGKIRAIRHARESDVPFLGICLGLQCAVIEHAR